MLKVHVAVIGAGVFGCWTAEHLRRAGNRVTLVDAWGPAHARASSGGETRMTRAAYGKDAIYSQMAFDSLQEWKALSDRSGLPLFIAHGVLFFTAFLPSFIDPARPLLTQFIVIAGTFAGVEFLTEMLIAGMAQRINAWLARVGRRFNQLCGGIIAAIGALIPLRA